MPLTIPAFTQYQQPMIPLPGLWNKMPIEGDKYVNVEIDWLATTNNTNAVQFALSGNSPVSLSQIAAMAVDNTRCGADVKFLFPDSGFSLVVPAHNSGVFPVITNALMFYAICIGASTGDVTVFQILNSIPPVIPIAPSEALNSQSVSPISLSANGSTQLVPAGISGTLNTISLMIAETTGVTIGAAGVVLQDGTGKVVWQTRLNAPANTSQTVPINLTGLGVRFYNGLSLVISSTTFTGDWIGASVYYTVP